MKLIISALAMTVALGGLAFAEGHTGNSANARAMSENIKTYGGGIAPVVSGRNAASPGDSGWGNAGSRVTGSGGLSDGYTAGGQVSKSGKSD